MWFDARTKLAEIAAQHPATSATPATRAPAARPVSQTSQQSTSQNRAFCVAEVASVATPPRPQPAPRAWPTLDAETFPFGTACNMGDSPRTWTGRIVSLDDWRRLSEWERNGPNGRMWCGLCRAWHLPEAACIEPVEGQT